MSADANYSLPVDPPHSHLAAMQQLHGRIPKMNGFVAAYLKKASGLEAIPYIRWGRMGALIWLLAGVLALFTGWLGQEWATTVALAGILAATCVGQLLLRRRIVPHPWRIAGSIVVGASAFAFLAHLFGQRWSTAIGFGVLLGFNGTLQLLCIKAKPRYVHPRTREEAIEDAPKVMRCMSEDKIPVLARLAREFAICARWHCSLPGETWPNRQFAHAGTSEGTTGIQIGFYKAKTVFELLSDEGKGWHIYFHGIPQVAAFPRLLEKGRASNWFHFDEFADHVAQDRLPEYSFIEPSHTGMFSNSQHPGNNFEPHDGLYDFQRGEQLIGGIYETLRAKPEVFNKTVFLITYDEHGGLFDHEPPPTDAVPPSIRKYAVSWTRKLVSLFVTYRGTRFGFRMLGPRVPTVIISPWVRRGFVDDTCVYDHSSIVASLARLFLSKPSWLTRRDRSANDFLHLLQLDRPRGSQGPDSLPELSDELRATARSAEVEGAETGRRQEGPSEFAQQLDSLAARLEAKLIQLGAEEALAARPAVREAFEAAIDREPNGHVLRLLNAHAERERSRPR